MDSMRSINSCIFLILLFFISLSINVFVVTGHCLGHQQSALLHLKNSLTFNPAKSQKLVHWNQSFICCQWSGVTCSKGRVIALDLSEESVSGGLDSSSSLFNLTYLQDLKLAYNDFHSSIPSKLYKLKRLRYLNLSNAGFEGHIPTEISWLTRLVSLDLSTSLHTLKLERPNIANLLQNLTKITALYMDGVRILAEGKEWGHALSSLKNLQILSLSSCNLSGPIDSSLSKLQSLLVLRLNQNNLACSFPKSFVSLTKLTTLQLNSCNLSGAFPIKIFQLPNLQVIDVSNNQDLHGSIPKFPHHGSLINTLNLSHTIFSGQLPYSIHKSRNLSILDLSSSQFNGTLPKSMSELTQLVHLDLSLNNFIGPLPYFNMSKNLTYLSVSVNQLTGEIPSSHFKSLDNLITIDLVGNYFFGRVPSSLFSLPSLRELMLSHNRFEGVLDEFPNASLSSLEFIDASGNNLQGPIPLSIFHLRRLRGLQLSLNKFNGTISLATIKRMEKLEILNLNNNYLSVDTTLSDNDDLSSFPKLSQLSLASCKLKNFPIFLRNQSNLRILDLSNNHIQGVIPSWIWRFDFMAFLNLSNNLLTDLERPFQNISSNLFLIDLHSNQLKGPTPILSRSVIYLDLSSNKFSHIAPSDFGNQLPFLYFLSLSNNSLHGKFHESLCSISTLRILDLSNNGFNGTMHECLTRINTLRALNLARNKFKGQISDTFSNSCSLRFLDLNENFLEGSIPKSLTNCQKLQVLNLGNNHLTDRFPCFLSNMSTLKVMILRSNNFHGPLDCPHSIGNWETLQIVDLASNSFSGTLPGPLLRSWKALMIDDEVSSKFGHLVFDIFDNVNPMDIKSAWMPIANKDLALKLSKGMNIGMPPIVMNHLFYDTYAELFEIRSYQDSVTIVTKGRQVKLVKILIAFTSLDFSSNHFEGSIPEELMGFKALHALNLSQNAFSSHIPSSIGHLKNLESLDLSMNSLSGTIPIELTSLSFLAVLNLSFNHLIGPIPIGTQIQSFEADSFEGNDGLCGPPLTQNCSFGAIPGSSSPSSETSESNSKSALDWNFLSVELGFTFGLGVLILPLMFWRQWRIQYFNFVNYILWKIFPQLDFVNERHGGKNYRTLRWKPF
ncbi:hypothetical protein K1719_040248 [Acacia pycnantha]|nr:hypothetical protein K1719_040248 [Acacia pycnantha]